MSISNRYILEQRRVIAGMAKTAYAGLMQQRRGESLELPSLPTPEISATFAPLSAKLVRDYIRHVGGDPSSYRGQVPAHLFPQWGFALASQTLEGIPYPLLKVMNGGCRLECRAPLPLGEPIVARACLESVDDNGRRAVLVQRVVSGTASEPEAVIARLYAIVPTGGKRSNKGKESREVARVPAEAREIGYTRIGQGAGLDFARLTGDFNPIHWVPAYARAAGFRNIILHGFSTMARAFEGLHRAHIADGPNGHASRRISVFDVKFTKPVVLPAKVGLYILGQSVYVGDAPGGAAYMTGTFELV